ncbi:sensor histidine kinase [Longitalea luteola]|uniref:sensor histidine kinase n=1 Tax=Longitalea luteola TaxID=2812563 RepID=UPI001A96BC92|nr:histidine kinase [Longitalea luteola]
MQAAEKYPFIFSDEPRYRFRRHLAFWVFWWLFQGVLYSVIGYNGKPVYGLRLIDSILESLAYMTTHIALSYALMYFVIPRYLLKQKYLLTVLWVFLCFLGAAVLSVIISITVIPEIQRLVLRDDFNNYLRVRASTRIHLSLMAGLRGGITIGGIAASIKLMKHWYVKEQRNLQLQKENAEAQLQLLKAQVHPHFLFNTLNNIYSHTQNTAPVASQLVMGLSDMLRFILYECNQPLVPLSKELKMIRDYISLEQIRYDDQLDVHVDLPDNTDNLGIAPLLLLPLVENCFKHGTSHMIEQPWLNLEVHIENNRMYVKLLNGKSNTVNHNNCKGIGISNVRKRLDLLYPGKHAFTITDEEDVFIVDLWLALDYMPLTQKESAPFKLAYHG